MLQPRSAPWCTCTPQTTQQAITSFPFEAINKNQAGVVASTSHAQSLGAHASHKQHSQSAGSGSKQSTRQGVVASVTQSITFHLMQFTRQRGGKHTASPQSLIQGIKQRRCGISLNLTSSALEKAACGDKHHPVLSLTFEAPNKDSQPRC